MLSGEFSPEKKCYDIFLSIFGLHLFCFHYMETLGNKKVQKKCKIFYCTNCDYNTSRKSSFERHVSTSKHTLMVTMETDGNQNVQKTCNQFVCKTCNKFFKYRSGLWKHNQKHNHDYHEQSIEHQSIYDNKNEQLKIEDIGDRQMIMQLLTQNQELQKTIIELTKNGITTYNSNINSNNKTFNLQVFLNETCKDAMNITDFVNSIQPTLEDLENVGRVGYAEGISNIILNNLSKMKITERPIHCSDAKREVMYIKYNNSWNKEADDKPVLLRSIKDVANKNIQNINEWKKANPDCTSSESKKNDFYLRIVSNSMCGLTKEETDKNFNKIISKLSKEVTLTDAKIMT